MLLLLMLLSDSMPACRRLLTIGQKRSKLVDDTRPPLLIDALKSSNKGHDLRRWTKRKEEKEIGETKMIFLLT